jgi:2-amino-4-hydroxy-6-hydroxymethyldihydropteridine diphosphokinase
MRHPALLLRECSSVCESEPWGYVSDNSFLNAVIEVEWSATPAELAQLCQSIELALGRRHDVSAQGYSDRPIDLDILWMQGVQIAHPQLSIPHPQAHRRGFVLLPLAELNPGLMLGELSVSDWITELPPGESELIMLLDGVSIDPRLS